MSSRTFGEKKLSRRAFMVDGAAAGVGLMGLSAFLAACADTSTNGALTVVSLRACRTVFRYSGKKTVKP